MEIEEIRELVALMVENDLAELDITDGESKIRLKRGPGGEVTMGSPVAQVLVPRGPGQAEAPPAAAQPAAEAAEELLEIKSPMVGTFYAAPGPDSEPFVSVGSTVGPDDVVCVVEAMKVMNEIKAECAGRIVEICVTNAEPVEFGQVLFRVGPG